MITLSRLALRLGVLAFAVALGLETAPFASAQQLPPPNPPADNSEEAAFLAENDAAMTKMMNGMAVKPTGDIDRDFALMMIPHHQGAVDMAMAELRYGKNEQLRRIAQEIIVEQMQEIAAMRLAIGDPLPPSAAAPTQAAPAATPAEHSQQHHHSMSMP